jgi:DNA-binding XRE family transcriptional regulator
VRAVYGVDDMVADPTVEDGLAADLEIGDGLLPPRVSAQQLRAARAMLNVTQRQVAGHLAVSVDTIWRLESGHRSTERTRKQVETLLKRNGVIFEPNGGVRLKRAASDD